MELSDDGLWAELEKTYCPPVDSALFAAVASDFDLAHAESVQQLRQALDIIKESAIQQENETFDPTGTANLHALSDADIDGIPSELGTSPRGHNTLNSHTEGTSMGSCLLPSDGEDIRANSASTSHIAYTVTADGSLELLGATEVDKVNLLHTMFSGMSRLNIEQTLRKNNGDLNKSMDVLLNLAFFDEAQEAQDDTHISIPKGIDGFGAEENCDIGRHKGRKKKRNKNQKLPLPVDDSSEGSPTPNRWEIGTADIEFISSRTPDIPKSKIKSVYHANGMSLPATLRVIAEENAPKNSSEIDDDPVLVTQLSELGQQFKTIPDDTLVGLLKITRNIFSAASELAEVLGQRPHPKLTDVIKFTTVPLDFGDENDENVPIAISRQNEDSGPRVGFERAQAAANAHFAARDSALQQAAQAARRAKSNHLYGGASAYYRQKGQEQRELAMQHLSVASDRLVDRQSLNCDLDLHGVTVANAIRITRERVEAWWDALGDTRYVRGGGKSVHGGFKIVTGVGRHSYDGTSRLGPAVSKVLMSEGWRFEIDRGCLLVVGRSRN